MNDFDEYQDFTATTAIYPADSRLDEICYLSLGLNGEAGEVADKVKKILRDQSLVITIQNEIDIADELGDVLYYLARLADVIGFDLSEVANANVAKLRGRKERGVLGGSGDNR